MFLKKIFYKKMATETNIEEIPVTEDFTVEETTTPINTSFFDSILSKFTAETLEGTFNEIKIVFSVSILLIIAGFFAYHYYLGNPEKSEMSKNIQTMLGKIAPEPKKSNFSTGPLSATTTSSSSSPSSPPSVVSSSFGKKH